MTTFDPKCAVCVVARQHSLDEHDAVLMHDLLAGREGSSPLAEKLAKRLAPPAEASTQPVPQSPLRDRLARLMRINDTSMPDHQQRFARWWDDPEVEVNPEVRAQAYQRADAVMREFVVMDPEAFDDQVRNIRIESWGVGYDSGVLDGQHPIRQRKANPYDKKG